MELTALKSLCEHLAYSAHLLSADLENEGYAIEVNELFQMVLADMPGRVPEIMIAIPNVVSIGLTSFIDLTSITSYLIEVDDYGTISDDTDIDAIQLDLVIKSRGDVPSWGVWFADMPESVNAFIRIRVVDWES